MGAAEGVVRVKLPSGGWWDIRTRPLWKDVSEWRRPVPGGVETPGLLESALVSLTTGWSFSEDIGTQSLASRDDDDVAAVLEVFCAQADFLGAAGRSGEDAERLFAALASGRVPADFAEAHLMLETGWSWRELQDTPADVVERTWVYLAVREAREVGGALDLSEGGTCDARG